MTPDEIEALKKLVRELLEDVRTYSDGCGCCAMNCVAEHGNFKEIEKIVSE